MVRGLTLQLLTHRQQQQRLDVSHGTDMIVSIFNPSPLSSVAFRACKSSSYTPRGTRRSDAARLQTTRSVRGGKCVSALSCSESSSEAESTGNTGRTVPR
jgi:hypothetical protein